MKETKIVSAFVLALALLSIGCASDVPKGAAYPAPPGFQGFPRSTSDEGVHVEAFFDPDHEDVFDIDLVEGGVIPVRLKIQLRGEGMSTKIVKLDRDLWDMRLYLQDGTVVPAVSAAKLAATLAGDDARRVRDNALETTLLGEEVTQGYVFFELVPEGGFRADGEIVYHVREASYRPLRIPDSLVAFNVSLEDALRPFYVGIQP